MLNIDALKSISARGVTVPRFDRSGAVGVVHLGLGAFHRAHQAVVFDRLLAGGDGRWGVCGVAMRSPMLVDTLATQDHLYSVQFAAATGSRWQVGGALWRSCFLPQARPAVVQALAAHTTRWVTLTVTEKGYGPSLAELLVDGLAARRAAGQGGLTLASCDNLRENGRSLQSLCVQAAQLRDPDLASWISNMCAFPNSMVDRIVPAGSTVIVGEAQEALGVTDNAALRTESFWEWVVEARFVDPSDAATLAMAGVQVVADVAPFEEAKLRMLNASHSAMACIGAVAGLPVISDCIAQPVVHRFVYDMMTCEIGPLLRRPDWADYRDALLARFANPHLHHGVHQIATDSSLKIAVRWVPAALDALRAAGPFERLAFCAAVWMRYCQGVDEAGQSYALSDPIGEQLQAMAHASRKDPVQTFETLGRLPAVWGDILAREPQWRSAVIRHLENIRSQGVLASAAQIAPVSP